MFYFLKFIHVVSAIATISGFVLRVYWMARGSAALQRTLTRVLPHVIDTVFLLSGIAMLYQLSLNPFTQSWLLAKFAGLIAYIVLGTIAIKRGPTMQIRLIAAVAAVAVFAYIAGVARAHSIASWLAYLTA